MINSLKKLFIFKIIFLSLFFFLGCDKTQEPLVDKTDLNPDEIDIGKKEVEEIDNSENERKAEEERKRLLEEARLKELKRLEEEKKRKAAELALEKERKRLAAIETEKKRLADLALKKKNEAIMRARYKQDLIAQAKAGNPYKQLELARSYYHDIYNYGKDIRKGVHWYIQSAARGIAEAQYELGMIYTEGVNVETNYFEARRLFLDSAYQGNLNAQYQLKNIYNNRDEMYKIAQLYLKGGESIDIDNTRAIYWLEKSSQLGNLDAIYHLGVLYFWGLVVEKNTKRATELIKKAYNAGHLQAKHFWEENQLWNYQ